METWPRPRFLFAWYQVNGSLSFTDPANKSTGVVSVANTDTTATSLNVQVVLSIDEDTSTSGKANQVMAAYADAAEGTSGTAGYHPAGWYTQYTSNSRNYYHELGANETHYRVYKVSAKLTGDAMSDPEFAGLLSDETKNLEVSATIDSSVTGFTGTYQNAMKLWTVNGSTLGAIAAPGSNGKITIAAKNLTASDQVIGYVVYYVDGTDASVATLTNTVVIKGGIAITGEVK